MKKAILLCMVLSVVSLLGFTGLAEQNVPDSLTFRGIEWFMEKMIVEYQLEEYHDIFMDDSAGYSTGFHIDYFDSGENFLEWQLINYGCVEQTYYGIPVADYEALRLKLRYAYPIWDGQINYNLDFGELIMAEYDIPNGSESEAEGVYNDIVRKLSELYGPYKEKGDDSDRTRSGL